MRVTKIIIDCNTIDEFNNIYSKIFGETITPINSNLVTHKSEIPKKPKQEQFIPQKERKKLLDSEKIEKIAQFVIDNNISIAKAMIKLHEKENMPFLTLDTYTNCRIKNTIKEKGFLYKSGKGQKKVELIPLEKAKAQALESIAKDEEYMDKCRNELNQVKSGEEQMREAFHGDFSNGLYSNEQDNIEDYVNR